eukprot:2392083-Amphidinium_carterae.2
MSADIAQTTQILQSMSSGHTGPSARGISNRDLQGKAPPTCATSRPTPYSNECNRAISGSKPSVTRFGKHVSQTGCHEPDMSYKNMNTSLSPLRPATINPTSEGWGQ